MRGSGRGHQLQRGFVGIDGLVVRLSLFVAHRQPEFAFGIDGILADGVAEASGGLGISAVVVLLHALPLGVIGPGEQVDALDRTASGEADTQRAIDTIRLTNRLFMKFIWLPPCSTLGEDSLDKRVTNCAADARAAREIAVLR